MISPVAARRCQLSQRLRGSFPGLHRGRAGFAEMHTPRPPLTPPTARPTSARLGTPVALSVRHDDAGAHARPTSSSSASSAAGRRHGRSPQVPSPYAMPKGHAARRGSRSTGFLCARPDAQPSEAKARSTGTAAAAAEPRGPVSSSVSRVRTRRPAEEPARIGQLRRAYGCPTTATVEGARFGGETSTATGEAQSHQVAADAWMMIEDQNFSAAVEKLNTAIEARPASPQLYASRAMALLEVGNVEGALSDCRSCISVAPDDVDGYLRLASLCMTIGRTAVALDGVQQGLLRFPGHEDLMRLLQQLQGGHEEGPGAGGEDCAVAVVVAEQAQNQKRDAEGSEPEISERETQVCPEEENAKKEPEVENDAVATNTVPTTLVPPETAKKSNRFEQHSPSVDARSHSPEDFQFVDQGTADILTLEDDDDSRPPTPPLEEMTRSTSMLQAVEVEMSNEGRTEPQSSCVLSHEDTFPAVTSNHSIEGIFCDQSSEMLSHTSVAALGAGLDHSAATAGVVGGNSTTTQEMVVERLHQRQHAEQDAEQIEVSDKQENALHLQQVAADVIIANRTLDAFAGEGVVPMSKEEIEASVLAAKQVAAVLLPEWDTPGAQDGQDVRYMTKEERRQALIQSLIHEGAQRNPEGADYEAENFESDVEVAEDNEPSDSGESRRNGENTDDDFDGDEVKETEACSMSGNKRYQMKSYSEHVNESDKGKKGAVKMDIHQDLPSRNGITISEKRRLLAPPDSQPNKFADANNDLEDDDYLIDGETSRGHTAFSGATTLPRTRKGGMSTALSSRLVTADAQILPEKALSYLRSVDGELVADEGFRQLNFDLPQNEEAIGSWSQVTSLFPASGVVRFPSIDPVARPSTVPDGNREAESRDQKCGGQDDEEPEEKLDPTLRKRMNLFLGIKEWPPPPKTAGAVPAPPVSKFIQALYSILEGGQLIGPRCQFTVSLITWTRHGTAFCIHEPRGFQKHVLPQYLPVAQETRSGIGSVSGYNVPRIIKTLRDHGFTRFDRYDTDTLEFHHPHFVSGKPQDLHKIKPQNRSSMQFGELPVLMPRPWTPVPMPGDVVSPTHPLFHMSCPNTAPLPPAARFSRSSKLACTARPGTTAPHVQVKMREVTKARRAMEQEMREASQLAGKPKLMRMFAQALKDVKVDERIDPKGARRAKLMRKAEIVVEKEEEILVGPDFHDPSPGTRVKLSKAGRLNKELTNEDTGQIGMIIEVENDGQMCLVKWQTGQEEWSCTGFSDKYFLQAFLPKEELEGANSMRMWANHAKFAPKWNLEGGIWSMNRLKSKLKLESDDIYREAKADKILDNIREEVNRAVAC